MNCRACGSELAADAVFCHKCGERVDRENPAPELFSPEPPAEALRRPNPPSQTSPIEEPLWEGRYSSKDLVGVWAIEGLVTFVLLLIGYYFPYSAVWLTILGVLALMWGYTVLLYFYRRMSVRYRLTTQRFFHERGVLRHVTDRVEVIDMDDITTEQYLLQRFVNVGRIKIVSSDRTSPLLVLSGIDNPHAVAQMLDDARRQERMKRGLHIEAI